jgi:hypothetical protein
MPIAQLLNFLRWIATWLNLGVRTKEGGTKDFVSYSRHLFITLGDECTSCEFNTGYYTSELNEWVENLASKCKDIVQAYAYH